MQQAKPLLPEVLVNYPLREVQLGQTSGAHISFTGLL